MVFFSFFLQNKSIQQNYPANHSFLSLWTFEGYLQKKSSFSTRFFPFLIFCLLQPLLFSKIFTINHNVLPIPRQNFCYTVYNSNYVNNFTLSPKPGGFHENEYEAVGCRYDRSSYQESNARFVLPCNSVNGHYRKRTDLQQ